MSNAAQALLETLPDLLDAASPLVAQTFHAAIIGAWLGGAEDVSTLLPASSNSEAFSPAGPPANPPRVTILPAPDDDDDPILVLPATEKALASLQSRRVLTADDYYALDAKAKQDALAITSGLKDESALAFADKVREILVDKMDTGLSYRSFRRDVLDAFDTLPIAESHLEQVYRNNVNEAFAQGQEHVLSHPLVEDEFPYRAYYAIHDGRCREEHLELEHLGLNGTNIYYYKDPTWLRFRPPWSWGCRCGWAPVTIEDAAAAGVREAKTWFANIRQIEKAGGSRFLDGVEPAHPPVKPPPFRPDPKWERSATQFSTDDEGHEHKGKGKGGGQFTSKGGGGAGHGETSVPMHNIKVPKSGKLSIDQARDAMKQMGYKVGNPKYDLKSGQTLYEVIHPDGRKLQMSAKQITDAVMTGARNYQEAPDERSGNPDLTARTPSPDNPDLQ